MSIATLPQLYRSMRDRAHEERRKERESEREYGAKGRRISNPKLSTRAHSPIAVSTVWPTFWILIDCCQCCWQWQPQPQQLREQRELLEQRRMCKIKQKLIHNNSRSTADPVINYSLRSARLHNQLEDAANSWGGDTWRVSINQLVQLTNAWLAMDELKVSVANALSRNRANALSFRHDEIAHTQHVQRQLLSVRMQNECVSLSVCVSQKSVACR